VLQPPEQAVEQVEAAGIAVLEHDLAERQEAGGHAQRRRRSGTPLRAGRGLEEIAFGVLRNTPGDPGGLGLLGPEAPASGAEAGDVDRARQRHRARQGASRRGGAVVGWFHAGRHGSLVL
jgi:hypothetical protein